MIKHNLKTRQAQYGWKLLKRSTNVQEGCECYRLTDFRGSLVAVSCNFRQTHDHSVRTRAQRFVRCDHNTHVHKMILSWNVPLFSVLGNCIAFRHSDDTENREPVQWCLVLRNKNMPYARREHLTDEQHQIDAHHCQLQGEAAPESTTESVPIT